jgi:hypothetical protein
MTKPVSREAERLSTLLREKHCGRNAAISRDKLRIEFYAVLQMTDPWGYRGDIDADMPDRSFRQLKAELIDAGEPICSHPAYGYWYAANYQEGEESAQELEKKARDMLKEAKRTRENCSRVFGSQMDLI